MVAEQRLEATSANFLSSAFDPATASNKALGLLPRVARSAALEFRLKEELLPDEHANGDHMTIEVSSRGRLQRVPPVGDAILAQSAGGVGGFAHALDVIHESSHAMRWFKTSYPASGSPPRVAYGFTGKDLGRPAERALVCLAADVCFEPYATGFWDETRLTRTHLRLDLRATAILIWTWAVFEHLALSYVLSAARYNPRRQKWMAFEPFTKLYRAVFGLHMPADDDRVDEVAMLMSELTVERLQFVKPGRSAKRHLYAPLLRALYQHPDPVLRRQIETPDLDPLEELARGAAPVLRQVFLGALDPKEATTALDALRSGVDDVSPDRA